MDEKIDITQLREIMHYCDIHFIPHAIYVQEIKGRPEKEFVEYYINERIDKLYKVEHGRKGRIILSFYMSKKYDLTVIAKIENNMLKIITYYKYLKKKIKMC